MIRLLQCQHGVAGARGALAWLDHLLPDEYWRIARAHGTLLTVGIRWTDPGDALQMPIRDAMCDHRSG